MTEEKEVPRKFKRQLPCDLTEEEKVKKGHKAGQLKKKIQKVKLEMKAATAGHKEQLKDHQANLDTILDELEAGQEERNVECYEKKDFTKKRAVVIRCDTNAEIESRTLSAEEFQIGLPDVKDVGLTDDDDEAADPAPKKGRGRPKKVRPEASA